MGVLTGLPDHENIGLACLIMFIGCLEPELDDFLYFLAAILKSRNITHVGVCANDNIIFWIPEGLRFPKMYRFANHHETPTEIHSEPA